jgi:hypothetical protein
VLIPAVMYGDKATVQQRAHKLAARIKQGEDLIAVVTEGGMLDTATTPGQLMLSAQGPGQRADFYCYLLWRSLTKELYMFQATPAEPTPLDDQLFALSIGVAWGMIGMLAYENHTWVRPERFATFLDAVLNMWDELCAVGARYFWEMDDETLWSIPSNLHLVLARMGVSERQLSGPLPHGGLRGLVQELPLAN